MIAISDILHCKSLAINPRLIAFSKTGSRIPLIMASKELSVIKNPDVSSVGGPGMKIDLVNCSRDGGVIEVSFNGDVELIGLTPLSSHKLRTSFFVGLEDLESVSMEVGICGFIWVRGVISALEKKIQIRPRFIIVGRNRCF